MRQWIILVEAIEQDTPVERFLDELWEVSTSHPFSHRHRIVNNTAMVEVRPDVDDRNNAVHIFDIMSLYAGERQGAGRDALTLLLRLADKYHVTLTLHPKAYAKGPGSKKFPKTKALVDWYSRYGFKRSHDGDMVRTPYQSGS